jgi:Dolichyl-phosphate-mannose-protein mannosyltransferase
LKTRLNAFNSSSLNNGSRYAYGRIFWGALALLVVTRLLLLSLEVAPASDSAWYFNRAIELLSTGRYAEGGIATAYWPVGYPGFLAGAFWLFGPTVFVGSLANLVLSVLTLLLLYKFCLEKFDNVDIANLSVVLLALYPNHMGYAVGLNSEPLYTVLLMSAIAFVTSKSSYPRFATVGVLLGLATLVKTQTMMLGPILLFLLATRTWSFDGVKFALGRTMVGLIFMLLTVAPWTWRNQIVMGAFIPVSTNGGMSLLAGNNASMTTALDHDFNERDPVFRAVSFSVLDQVAADKRARVAAFDWIASNPIQFIALMPKKAFRFWIPDGESEWTFQAGFKGYDHWKLWFRSVRVLNQIFYFLVLGGMAYALLKHCRFKKPTTLVFPLLMLFFTTLSLVFSGQSRYHAPLMPFAIAFASYAFIRFWSKRETFQ